VKSLTELDHYEVLEVPRDASSEGIERAYRMAQVTYAEDSLAGYSILGDVDSQALRERVETAFRVLADEDSRRAYDAALRATAPRVEPAEELRVDLLVGVPEEPAAAALPFEDLAEEGGAEYDGARLRRTRMRRGLDVDDVARATKVNPTYLRFLEDERFEELPARVYVRGFVTLYASCVGLEPKSVAEDYMRRFDQSRAEPGQRGARS